MAVLTCLYNEWQLSFSHVDRSKRLTFELLAKRAGRMVRKGPSQAPLGVWLDEVKARAFKAKCEGWLPTAAEDGSSATGTLNELFASKMRNTATFVDVFEISADLCLESLIRAEDEQAATQSEVTSNLQRIDRDSDEVAPRVRQDVLRLFQTHPSWISVHAQVLEAMNALPSRCLALINEGRTPEQAQVETRLEGFDLQAKAYLELISDVPTFRAYLGCLQLLYEGERKKAAKKILRYPKPDGINPEFWDYAIANHPGTTEKNIDPLGSEIVWFEIGISERLREWTAKAYRRAADLGLSFQSMPEEQASRHDRSPAWEETQPPNAARNGSPIQHVSTIVPVDHPEICIEEWDEIPADHKNAIWIPGEEGTSPGLLQHGFHLFNEGQVAYDVTVEDFEIDQSVKFRGGYLRKLGTKEKGFVLTWLDGIPDPTGRTLNPAKFDLRAAMANAADRKFKEFPFPPDFSVPVFVSYRDTKDRWYRSGSEMVYIKTRHQIEFRSIRHNLPLTSETSSERPSSDRNDHSTGSWNPPTPVIESRTRTIVEHSSSSPQAGSWGDISIVFVSDHSLQVSINSKVQPPMNYIEFGLGNSKNGNPRLAWETLKELAEREGLLDVANLTGYNRNQIEKRIQEIRGVLRRNFKVDGNPLPFGAGFCYRACFKISCSRAYNP
jgi:hypothetical protein